MATGVECREANDTLSIGEGKLIMRWTLEVNGMTMTVINGAFLTAASAVGCALMFLGFMTSMATLLTRR